MRTEADLRTRMVRRTFEPINNDFEELFFRVQRIESRSNALDRWARSASGVQDSNSDILGLRSVILGAGGGDDDQNTSE